jgi:putative flippase GtrA
MKIAIPASSHLFQFSKFCLVGCSNTGVHYIIFIVLLHMANMHYLAASVLGYTGGMANSLFWNSRWTFAGHARLGIGHVARFFTVNIGSLLVNAGTLYIVVEHCNPPPPELGQLAAIAAGLVVNFIGCRIFVFL